MQCLSMRRSVAAVNFRSDLAWSSRRRASSLSTNSCTTSVSGVYAAGDLAAAPQQVAVALGSGHTAGFVAARELLVGRPAPTESASARSH